MLDMPEFELIDTHEQWPNQISPLQELKDDLFTKAGLEVLIKRDDLLQPYGGNKWRKLKYNFLQMYEKGCREFLTFGGPFSNHVFASATLARQHALKATFFIRGSVDDFNNPVLKHARDCGAKLVAVDRKTYAKRYTREFKAALRSDYPAAYFIPEGGANQLGLRGCGEIVTETLQQRERRPDYWVVAAGTANTASGIVSRLSGNEKVMAIAALRMAIMDTAFQASLELLPESERRHMTLVDAYHFGGMAKWNDELIEFIQNFEIQHGVLLDPVYTGKAMYALYDLVGKGEFERGSTIIFVHTGGMPGRMSFNYRFGELLRDPAR